MCTYIGTLELTPIDSDEGRNWSIDTACLCRADNGDTIETAVGDTTDLASIPRALWWIWPPEGLYTEPAVFHDESYRQQKFTRLRCDQILLEGMTDKGVGWFARHAIYAGVRVGGWVAWNQHAKENANKNKQPPRP